MKPFIRSVLFPIWIAATAFDTWAVSGRAGAFAPLPVGARGAGLAGAQTANPEASDALFINPAGITQIQAWHTGYYHANAYGLVPYHQVDAIYRQPGQPFWGAAAWKQNGDDVYSENEVRLGAGFQREYMRVGATWNLRYAGTGSGGTDFRDPETGLNRRVDATGMGYFGFDAGAIAQPFGPRYGLGVAFHDILSRIAWNSSNEAGTANGEYAQYLPIGVRFGLYAHPDDAVSFHLDYEPSLYHDGLSRIASGFEAMPMEWLPDSQIKKVVHDLVSVRIGYARNMFSTEAFHRLAAGGGLKMAYAGMTLTTDMAYEWVYEFTGHNSLRFGFQVAR
jgi:hypothetical protein